jgi:hypothetical protein
MKLIVRSSSLLFFLANLLLGLPIRRRPLHLRGVESARLSKPTDGPAEKPDTLLA